MKEEKKQKPKRKVSEDSSFSMDSLFARDENFAVEDFEMASFVEQIGDYDRVADLEASMK